MFYFFSNVCQKFTNAKREWHITLRGCKIKYWAFIPWRFAWRASCAAVLSTILFWDYLRPLYISIAGTFITGWSASLCFSLCFPFFLIIFIAAFITCFQLGIAGYVNYLHKINSMAAFAAPKRIILTFFFVFASALLGLAWFLYIFNFFSLTLLSNVCFAPFTRCLIIFVAISLLVEIIFSSHPDDLLNKLSSSGYGFFFTLRATSSMPSLATNSTRWLAFEFFNPALAFVVLSQIAACRLAVHGLFALFNALTTVFDFYTRSLISPQDFWAHEYLAAYGVLTTYLAIVTLPGSVFLIDFYFSIITWSEMIILKALGQEVFALTNSGEFSDVPAGTSSAKRKVVTTADLYAALRDVFPNEKFLAAQKTSYIHASYDVGDSSSTNATQGGKYYLASNRLPLVVLDKATSSSHGETRIVWHRRNMLLLNTFLERAAYSRYIDSFVTPSQPLEHEVVWRAYRSLALESKKDRAAFLLLEKNMATFFEERLKVNPQDYYRSMMSNIRVWENDTYPSNMSSNDLEAYYDRSGTRSFARLNTELSKRDDYRVRRYVLIKQGLARPLFLLVDGQVHPVSISERIARLCDDYLPSSKGKLLLLLVGVFFALLGINIAITGWSPDDGAEDNGPSSWG